MWFSGLSVILQTERLLVRFLVSVHAWFAGQIPSWECMRGSQSCALMFLSLSPFFPLPLKVNKNKIFKKFLVYLYDLAYFSSFYAPSVAWIIYFSVFQSLLFDASISIKGKFLILGVPHVEEQGDIYNLNRYFKSNLENHCCFLVYIIDLSILNVYFFPIVGSVVALL